MKDKKKGINGLFPINKYKFSLRVILCFIFICVVEYIYVRLDIRRVGIVAIFIGAINAVLYVSSLLDVAEKIKNYISPELLSNCKKAYSCIKNAVVTFCVKIDQRGMLRKLYRFLCAPLVFAFIIAYFAPIGHFLNRYRDKVDNFLYVIAGNASLSTPDETRILDDSAFEKRPDPASATFHLEDYYVVLTISEEEYDNIMFVNCDIDLENPYTIFSAVSARVNSCKSHSKADGTQTADMLQKNKIADISHRNDIFMSNTQECLEKFHRELESSATLDKIIEDWQELPESVKNYDIYWMLSNAYQKYALEYYHQDGSADTVLYYYALSIKYAHKALEYDATKDKISTTLLYISGRYDDLAYFQHILNPTERLLASEIADAYEQLYNLSIQ